MAEVVHNITLENKVNTVTLTRTNAVGEPDPYEVGTKLYIEDTQGNAIPIGGVLTGVGDVLTTQNVFVAIVDLSGVSGASINYDYDHPIYEHIYSVRGPNNVYLVGKLNIVYAA